MLLGGLQKTTLIDYPGHIGCVVFTAGCNFNCGYCHNPELRAYSPKLDPEEFFTFLRERQGQLQAVTITGGEPTVHADLPEFIRQIKALGYKVKLDSQGTNPEMLREILDEQLVDYVAMDIKAPIERYPEVVGVLVNGKAITESIALIMKHAPEYEFRTTVVQGQLGAVDMDGIGELINGAKHYYLQKFVSSGKVNDATFSNRTAPTEEEMAVMRERIAPYVSYVGIR